MNKLKTLGTAPLVLLLLSFFFVSNLHAISLSLVPSQAQIGIDYGTLCTNSTGVTRNCTVSYTAVASDSSGNYVYTASYLISSLDYCTYSNQQLGLSSSTTLTNLPLPRVPDAGNFICPNGTLTGTIPLIPLQAIKVNVSVTNPNTRNTFYANSSVNIYPMLIDPSISQSASTVYVSNTVSFTMSWINSTDYQTGTPPYNAVIYSTSSSGCSTSNPVLSQNGITGGTATISFNAPSTTGTYYYCGSVKDSSYNSSQTTYSSVADLVTAQVPTVSINVPQTSFDAGGENVGVGFVIHNGIGPFTVAVYASNGTKVSNTVTIGSPNSSGSITFQTPYSSGNHNYHLVVVDEQKNNGGSGNIYTFDSNNLTISVSAPSATLSITNSSLDQGQVETFNVGVSGGVGPFNVGIYNETGNTQVGGNLIIASPGGSNSISIKVSNTGSFSYNAIFADTGVSPNYTFSTPTSTIQVSNALSAELSANVPQSNTIKQGQLVEIGGIAVGGTSPFTYNFIVSNAMGVLHSSSSSSNVFSFNSLNFTYVGAPYSVNVVITDSASTPVTAGSASQQININNTPYITHPVASGSIFDVGQSVTYSNTTISDGENPFKANIMINGNVVDTVTTNALSPITYTYTPSSTGHFKYNISVVDTGNATDYSFNSTSSTVTFNTHPNVTLSTPANVYYVNETIPINVTISGGTGPFIENIYRKSSLLNLSIDTIYEVPDGSYVVNKTIEYPGNYILTVKSTDKGTSSPYNSISNSVPITILPIPSNAPKMSMTVNNTALDFGQSTSITIRLVNNTSPVNVSLYDTMQLLNRSGGESPYSLVDTFTNAGPNATLHYTFAPSPGKYYFYAVGKDNAYTPQYVFENNSLFQVISGTPGYPLYICEGSSGNNPISFSWNAQSNGTYSSVGNSISNVCMMNTTSGGEQIESAIIGVSSNTYTLYQNSENRSLLDSLSLTYNVPSASSTVLLAGACGYYNCTAVSLPSGCTQELNLQGTDTFDTVYFAICRNQPVGLHRFTMYDQGTGEESSFALAAYVFNGSVSFSNINYGNSGADSNPLFIAYNQTHALLNFTPQLSANDTINGGVNSIIANAIVSGGSGNFTFDWNVRAFNTTNTLFSYTNATNALVFNNFSTYKITDPRNGTYVFNIAIVDNNTTVPYHLSLNKTFYVGILPLSASCSSPGTVGQYAIANVTCTGTVISGLPWSLYVNGQLYGTTTNGTIEWSIQNAPGTYTFTFSNPGSILYKAYSTSTSLTVQQAGNTGFNPVGVPSTVPTTIFTTIPTTVPPTTIPQNSTNNTEMNLHLNITNHNTDINFGSTGIVISIHSNSTTPHKAYLLVKNETALNFTLKNYTKITVLDLNLTAANTTTLLNVTIPYNCGIPASVLKPFIDVNDTWEAITPFTVNATACTVTFQVPSDPVVGLYYRNTTSTANTTSTTAPATTTVQQTNTTTSPPAPPAQPSSVPIVVGVIILVVIIAAIFYFLKSRK